MNKLIELLSELHPDVDFNTADSLVDDGILDSLDIVALVAAIDTGYGIVLPAEEIVPENFNSVKALWALIMRLDEE